MMLSAEMLATKNVKKDDDPKGNSKRKVTRLRILKYSKTTEYENF